jgi:hypothetical protein
MLIRQFYGRHIATKRQTANVPDSLDGRRGFIHAKQRVTNRDPQCGCGKHPIYPFPAKAGTHGPVVSNFLSHCIAYRQSQVRAVEPWAPASAGEAIR